MLDIEISVEPDQNGLDIISVADLKKRLRITHSRLDDVISDAIIEVAEELHGIGGTLRRTIFPTTYKRYLSRFPDLKDSRGKIVHVGRGVIPLPFPNLIQVVEIAIEDGSSPTTAVDTDLYVVRAGTLVPEIELKTDEDWPEYDEGPRALSITYEAGYANGYPASLKRLVAIKAAHAVLNNSATINEPRLLQINRRIEFGVDDLMRQLQIPVSYDDWAE